MMEAIDPKTGKLYIQKLENILGEAWCKTQLAEYKEFTDKYSPTGLWSHRFPTTSPIVPLLFQYHYPKYRRRQPMPLGYWYGDPIHILLQLAGAICIFEDYWARLPRDMGASNIKYKLSNADQFNGFLFELLVGIDSKLYRYKDFEVEPLFFDPRTVEGGADIIIRKEAKELAIQCKTRSPLSALDMSFDIFQYVFGCFYRLVQDSGHSYKFVLNLNTKLELSEVDELLDLLNSAVRSGLQIPRHKRNSSYQVELSRLDIPISGLSESNIREILRRDTANLFCEVGGLNPNQGDATAFNRIAVFSVSARESPSLEETIIHIVGHAAGEARVSCPLILAIHLYVNTRWEDYLRNPSNQTRLRRRVDTILKSYPGIKYINVSSNRQEYTNLPAGEQLIQTQYLEITNHYYKG